MTTAQNGMTHNLSACFAGNDVFSSVSLFPIAILRHAIDIPAKTANSRTSTETPSQSGASRTSRNSVTNSGDGGVPQISSSPVIQITAFFGIVPNIPPTAETERVP